MNSVLKLTGIDSRLNVPPLLSRLKGLGNDAFLGTYFGNFELKFIIEICILGPYFYFCDFFICPFCQCILKETGNALITIIIYDTFIQVASCLNKTFVVFN